MDEKPITVRFVAGQAEVRMGSRSFTVSERHTDDRAAFCPIELVVAALGS